MNDVSVVIPHWNREDLLETVLRSIDAQSEPPDEVLVVDNGSSDGSLECARRHGARVIEMGANAGFSRAVNEGWKSSSTKWLLVLNNDVELESDFLATLCAAVETSGASFAVPCLLNAADPARIDGTFDLLARGACAWRAGHGRKLAEFQPAASPVWFPPLTAALLRRELAGEIGMLDECFESYLEDVDFGLRCALSGRSGVYVPLARARHRGSATLGGWSPAMVRLISRNQLYLVAKHYPQGWFRRYGRAVLAAQFLWGLVAMRHGCGTAWLKGKVEGIRRFSALRRLAAPANARRFDSILEESESQLRILMDESRDRFWSAYFALTR